MMWLSPGTDLRCVKLMPMRISEFFITYKDGDDLYQLFVDKLKELGIPPEIVYIPDFDGRKQLVSAEQLYEYANQASGMPVYVRDRNAYVNSFENRCHKKCRSSADGFVRHPTRSHSNNKKCLCVCHRQYPGHHCGSYSASYYGPFPHSAYFIPPYSYMQPCFGCPGTRMR